MGDVECEEMGCRERDSSHLWRGGVSAWVAATGGSRKPDLQKGQGSKGWELGAGGGGVSGWALVLVLLSLWGMGPVAQSTRGLWEPCQAVHVQFCLVVEVGVQLQPDLCLKGGQRGEALPKVTQLDERHACVHACVCVCARVPVCRVRVQRNIHKPNASRSRTCPGPRNST